MKTDARPTTPKFYIGLDAHKSSISVAYAQAGDCEAVYYGKLGGSNLALSRV